MTLVVMGLDPGTIKMGVAVLSVNPNSIQFVQCETLALSGKDPIQKRLFQIQSRLETIFNLYKPHHVAVEKIFLGKNPDSAFKLGHVFGISLCQAHKFSSQVFEYSTKTVKKTVAGSGGVNKESVSFFVKNALKIDKEIASLDASDALAVALCHAYYYQNKIHFKSNEKGNNL